MAKMRYDRPFIGWMIGRNRKRRMEADPSTPTIAPIIWLTEPPATGAINTEYTATWSGGLPPYHMTITGPGNVLLNDQVSHDGSGVLQVDGTNQPVGAYVWSINDAHGNKLTKTTTIS